MSFKWFTQVDNRICPTCGARAGQCEHTAAQERRVLISVGDHETKRWSPEEARSLDLLLETDLSYRQVALEMGRTLKSVRQKAHSLGWRGDYKGNRKRIGCVYAY